MKVQALFPPKSGIAWNCDRFWLKVLETIDLYLPSGSRAYYLMLAIYGYPNQGSVEI